MPGRPNTITTALRLVRLIRRMEAGETITSADVAAECSVHVRTAQRYLRAIRGELGLPVRPQRRDVVDSRPAAGHPAED